MMAREEDQADKGTEAMVEAITIMEVTKTSDCHFKGLLFDQKPSCSQTKNRGKCLE